MSSMDAITYVDGEGIKRGVQTLLCAGCQGVHVVLYNPIMAERRNNTLAPCIILPIGQAVAFASEILQGVANLLERAEK